jgi:hypothetical protein
MDYQVVEARYIGGHWERRVIASGTNRAIFILFKGVMATMTQLGVNTVGA